MRHESLNEDEQSRLADIKIDNYLIKKQLGLSRDEHINLEDGDPEQQNELLREILAFEQSGQGPKIRIRGLFPKDFAFPPDGTLTAAQLTDKLAAIRGILSEKHIYLDLQPSLPDAMQYQYLVDTVLDDEIMATLPQGFAYHIDGCSGCCQECFQHDYCATGRELTGEGTTG